MTSMNKSLPWATIDKPSRAEYVVRKIPKTEKTPLYWGKDVDGHCLFIIKLSGDLTEQFKKNTVQVRGLRSDLRQIREFNSQGMVITLEKHVDQDIFAAMCRTLIRALQDVDDSATSLSIAQNQIKRWKAFMAGNKRSMLSLEEIRGLYGELLFLKQLLTHLSEKDAITAWEGPASVQQDFIFSNTAVEIKTLSGRERNAIRIASEDQLESLNDKLYLKVYRLSEMRSSNEGASLNTLVSEIESLLSDYTANEMFQSKLAMAGYVELEDYDTPAFEVSGEHIYCVEPEFPKLVRSSIPDAISSVSYQVDINHIKKFERSDNVLWGTNNE